MQTDSPAVADTLTSAPTATEAATGALATLQGWWETLVEMIPNIVLAILIVIVAAVLARVVRKVVGSVLQRAADRAPQTKNVAELLGTLSYVAVLAVGTFVALSVLNLTGVVATLLGAAGVVGLALGFAFQDIASNFMAGVLMAVRNPFVVGEIIETNGVMGTVQELSLRSTIVETFQGQTVIIPNAKVYGDPITNYSTTGERRVDLGCGVGYGDDLAQAQTVAIEAVEGLSVRKESKPVQLYYTEFGDSSVNFVVRFWVSFSKQTDFLEAQSEAIKAVKSAFDDAGVTIPFPIRTLDFDPNGGVNLRSALKNTGDGAASGDDRQPAEPFGGGPEGA
ncbi:MAG: mechanosensitive ion channel family protein [Bacteroidota bacterium]